MFTANPVQSDRREFLRSCGRWSGLALLGGAVVGLARQGKLRPLNEACLAAHPCGGCAALDRCDFPAARAGRPTAGGRTS